MEFTKSPLTANSCGLAQSINLFSHLSTIPFVDKINDCCKIKRNFYKLSLRNSPTFLDYLQFCCCCCCCLLLLAVVVSLLYTSIIQVLSIFHNLFTSPGTWHLPHFAYLSISWSLLDTVVVLITCFSFVANFYFHFAHFSSFFVVVFVCLGRGVLRAELANSSYPGLPI